MSERPFEDGEEKLQQLADAADTDKAAAGYRFVRQAVREAPLPSIPADFAKSMELLTRDFDEQAGIEKWLPRFAVVAGGIATAAFAWPAILPAMKVLADAPLSLLMAAGVAAAAAWSIDRWLDRVGDR